jgi:SAM-dependent methyltransferase
LRYLWILHPAGVYRWLVRPVVDIVRDRLLGIDTAIPVRHGKLGFAADRGVHYVASNWGALAKVLKPGEITRDDTFLDAGCGKGAVLCQAMELPFGKIIGFDLSPAMCKAAVSNVQRIKKRSAERDVAVFEADASRFTIPDDVTVVYLFNPFVGPVFSAFIDNLVASLHRKPRRLRLVYNNPVMHGMVVERGFRLDRISRFWARPPSVIHLYEYVGSLSLARPNGTGLGRMNVRQDAP